MTTRKWEETYLVAYMWWCGDGCDCTRPMVEEISPNKEAGRPWIRRKALWSGTFASADCGDSPTARAAQTEELREAAWWYGVELMERKVGR